LPFVTCVLERIVVVHPPATRVAQPLTRSEMRMRTTVQGNQARFVDHLHENHHIVGVCRIKKSLL
jgi:hypothetical protein